MVVVCGGGGDGGGGGDRGWRRWGCGAGWPKEKEEVAAALEEESEEGEGGNHQTNPTTTTATTTTTTTTATTATITTATTTITTTTTTAATKIQGPRQRVTVGFHPDVSPMRPVLRGCSGAIEGAAPCDTFRWEGVASSSAGSALRPPRGGP